jgi:biotin transporter BioY
MYLLQSLIIGSIVVHNEYNHWTHNKVAASIIGFAAAYAVTWVIFRLRQEFAVGGMTFQNWMPILLLIFLIWIIFSTVKN